MPERTSKKSRREVINAFLRTGAVVTLGGLGLYAFAPDSSRVALPVLPSITNNGRPSPTKENPWILVEVPAETKAAEIDLTQAQQTPPIGIQKLYFGISENVPALVVATVFSSPSQMLPDKGSFGFQPITEPFQVDPDKIVTWYGIEDLGEVKNFSRNILPDMIKMSGDKLYAGGNSRIAVVRRPMPDSRFALVYDELATTFNGVPSPKSYLNLSFTFNRQRNIKGSI